MQQHICVLNHTCNVKAYVFAEKKQESLHNFTDGYANTQTVHIPTRKTTQLFGGKISASCFHITTNLPKSQMWGFIKTTTNQSY